MPLDRTRCLTLSIVDTMVKVSSTRPRTGPAAVAGSPAVLVSGGILLVGAAGYCFVALAGHTLSTSEAAASSSFYLLANIIGPGLFLSLEQETSRRTSHARAVGQSLVPVLRKTGVHAAGLLGTVVVILGLAAPVLIARSLTGHAGMLLAVVLAALSASAVYLVRGFLGGTQRFSGYAATLAGEGLARLLPVVAVALAGQGSALRYAILFACGSGVGAIAGLPWLVRRARTPDAEPTTTRELGGPPGAGMGFSLALLAVAALSAHVVANMAPIVVTARLTSDTAMASAFAAAFILVRIPLFLISPMQALLMPAMVAAVARQDYPGVRARLRTIITAVTGLGTLGVLGAALFGPWAVETLFGARVHLSGLLLALLAASTILLMTAQVLQPGLVALGAHRVIAVSWGVGTLTTACLLMLPGDPLAWAVLAQLVGPALLVFGMAAALAQRLRDCSPAYEPAE